MKAPNYTITGHMSTIASTGANSVKAKRLGRMLVHFNDGLFHEVYFPCIHVKGTTVGKRTFNFKHVGIVADKQANLATFITFNPDAKTGIGSFFSSKQKSYPDTFRGEIINFSDIKLSLSDLKHKKHKNYTTHGKINGEWTGFMNFDDTLYWSVNDYPLIPVYKQQNTLPSDSTHRKDAQAWTIKDEKNAQQFKEEYEEIQRKDRKLREQHHVDK